MFGKEKGLVKGKVNVEDKNLSGYPMEFTGPIMMNAGVDICAEACSSCWDTPLPQGYDNKSDYIGRRSKTGHTSILEHSNTVFILNIYENELEDLAIFLATNNYLHAIYRPSEKYHGLGYLIIGGSWRGFSDLYLNMPDLSNVIMRKITERVYAYCPSNAFTDIINFGVLNKESFSDVYFDTFDWSIYHGESFKYSDDITIVNCDDVHALRNNLSKYCEEPNLFTEFDLLPFLTCTIKYTGMSRIITQQLTRHRNGITQESQRYVNYSGAAFNSPALFKNKYDPKHKYEIRLGSSVKMKLNLQEIGDMINSIYGQLDRKNNPQLGQYGLDNEDARAYLANNTQCGRIYITFTFHHLIKYLQLREDTHAQAEMNKFALQIGEWFRSIFDEYQNCYMAMIPYSKILEDRDNFFSVSITGDDDSSNKDRDIALGVEEILETHVKEYDESKEDPEVVDTTEETVLDHGEM